MTLVHPFPGHTALTTFEHLRRDLEGLIVRDTTGKMRAGVLPDHLNPLVTGRNTDMKLNVGDFRAVQNRGGAVLLANFGVDTSVTIVPPVANKRIDLIYATARSSNAPWSDGSGNNTPIIDVYQGTPGAVPQVPTLPAYLSSAIVLAMVEVPSNATTTLSAGVVITQLYQYTALAGGTVVVRNTVELAAWTPADGSRAYCLADTAEYVRSGGAWRRPVQNASRVLVKAAAPANASQQLDVTFPTPYGSAPTVTVSPAVDSAEGLPFVGVGNISATGFRVFMAHNFATRDLRFNWESVGL